MSTDQAKRHDGERVRSAAFQALRVPVSRRSAPDRWLAAVPGALALLVLQAPGAHALDCLPVSQPLVKIPEIARTPVNGEPYGVLRGTIVLIAEQQRMIFRSLVGAKGTPPGTAGATFECLPQTVRAFRRYEGAPAAVQLRDPVPGPTLRAKVGDIVALTFVNQLEANRFGKTRNEGDKDSVTGCDRVNTSPPDMGYPFAGTNPGEGGDRYPDCFNGSSTANIHFHGTHTDPDGTGDNVFLQVRPSPRVGNKPTITPETYKTQFDAFFKECATHLKGNAVSEWPTNWNDAPLGPWTTPGTWTATQMSLLDAYDRDANTQRDPNKNWPQYYIGAYPYCFQLPAYQGAWPPSSGGIKMGQAPGTHWYHAHKHGSTAIDVANGMSGAFIIEGQYDEDLDLFYGTGWTRRQPVMVLNQLGVSPNLMRSAGNAGQQDKGPDFSVNGRSQPIVDMAPGEVQLWRIVNSAARSGAYLAGFPPSFNSRQIAQDGVQFADANYQSSQNKPILIASGNRADLLVMAPKTAGTYPLLVRHDVDPSDLPAAVPVVLLQVRVRSDVPPATGNRARFIPTAPAQPAFLTNIADAEVVTSTDPKVVGTINNPRVVTFATANGPPFAEHTIDGLKFDQSNKPIPVMLNTVEEWKVVNRTFGPPISHPFHIHINPFQIVEVFNPKQTVIVRGKTVPKYVFYNDPPPAAEQCYLDPQDESTWKDCHNDSDPSKPRIWWDVFPIPSGAGATDAQGNPIKDSSGKPIQVPGYFKMRSRFVDFPGYYVIHCHILAHEDRGMMTVVSLQAANAPPAPAPQHH